MRKCWKTTPVFVFAFWCNHCVLCYLELSFFSWSIYHRSFCCFALPTFVLVRTGACLICYSNIVSWNCFTVDVDLGDNKRKRYGCRWHHYDNISFETFLLLFLPQFTIAPETTASMWKNLHIVAACFSEMIKIVSNKHKTTKNVMQKEK